MKIIFQGQVPKDQAFPETNEDTIAIENHRIAVSDGASESFDSKNWAKLLVSNFVSSTEINETWLEGVIKEYSTLHNPDTLSWSKKSAYERGSFATLLGLEYHSDTLNILGVGDSIAVLLNNGNFVDSFPHRYKSAADFQKKPELFCTDSVHNKFFYDANFGTEHHTSWDVSKYEKPIVLCMTDALAEWGYRNEEEGNSMWQRLANIDDIIALESLVLEERRGKKMRVDDTSLVILSFQTAQEDELPNI